VQLETAKLQKPELKTNFLQIIPVNDIVTRKLS